MSDSRFGKDGIYGGGMAKYTQQEDDGVDAGGEGLSGKQPEHALTVETSDGSLWTIPYGYFIPSERGAVGAKRQAFRFKLEDETYALVVEGDGTQRFHDILMKVARQMRIVLRPKGCVKSVTVGPV